MRKDEAEAEAEAKKKQDRVILAVSGEHHGISYADHSIALLGK